MNALARVLLDVLFASLWQGAFVALTVAAVLGLTGRRLNAATRYIVLQGALVAIVIVPLVMTLPNIMSQALIQGGHGLAGSGGARNLASGGLGMAAARRIDVTLGDSAVLTLAAAWIVGVLTFTVRIGAGSLQIRRLKGRSTRLADRGGVGVYASPDIIVPFAIGFTMPSVIVPTALAAEAGQEFECIVLHELAHLRRGDVWVNAYERALHAVLFFNPAMLLVLRAIAIEREAACDDWAALQSRDLDTYVRSLASFAVWGADASAVAACGASGFGRATVARIQRLEDARRNGAIALSQYALGGFALVLATIALTLQSFAPAIAFAPPTSIAPAIVASAACSHLVRYLAGPPPETSLPPGFKAQVLVRVSPSGKVVSATVFKRSGNASFDRAVVTAAKKGTYTPEMQNCKPVTGTYVFLATTS